MGLLRTVVGVLAYYDHPGVSIGGQPKSLKYLVHIRIYDLCTIFLFQELPKPLVVVGLKLAF